jgi:TRAP-type mannitol/chloroaromatic compound transport system permease small subunit
MVELFLRGYCRFVRIVIGFIGRSVAYLMPVLAGVVAYEVFARYILDKPTIWAYDTSLFLFGYIAALGGAYAQQKEAHINVDIVHGKVSEKVRRIFDLFTGILAMGFLGVMVYTCFDMFLQSVKFHYKTQSEWAPPMHHFWLMITVSATIFIAQYTTEFIANLFYLVTGRTLLEEDAPVALEEQPFKVDSHLLERSESDKGGVHGN